MRYIVYIPLRFTHSAWPCLRNRGNGRLLTDSGYNARESRHSPIFYPHPHPHPHPQTPDIHSQCMDMKSTIMLIPGTQLPCSDTPPTPTMAQNLRISRSQPHPGIRLDSYPVKLLRHLGSQDPYIALHTSTPPAYLSPT